MKARLATIALLALPLLLRGEPVDLRPEEYSWDNPGFRERFAGTYGVLSPVEPQISPEESRFLREEILPRIAADPGEAVAAVRERLSGSSSPALHFILGNLLLQEGRIPEARENLDRALALFPDFRRAHRSLALLEVRAGDYPASVPHWLEVIRLGGGDDQSYGLLGYAYLQDGLWNAASRAFENALVHRPGSRDLRRGLVQAFLQSGRPSAAAELIGQLLADDAEDPQLWKLLANHHLAEKNLERTAAALEVAARLAEPDPGTLLLLGNVYTSLGLPEQALAAYGRLLDLPASELDFPDAFEPVTLLLEQRLWEQADRYAGRLRAAFGRDLESEQRDRIHAAMATARLHTDPSEELAETAASYSGRFPLDGLLQLALGDYHAREGDVAEALLAYRRAAAIDSHRYEATLRLANLLVSEQRYREAIRRLRELQREKYSGRVAAFLSRLEDLVEN